MLLFIKHKEETTFFLNKETRLKWPYVVHFQLLLTLQRNTLPPDLRNEIQNKNITKASNKTITKPCDSEFVRKQNVYSDSANGVMAGPVHTHGLQCSGRSLSAATSAEPSVVSVFCGPVSNTASERGLCRHHWCLLVECCLGTQSLGFSLNKQFLINRSPPRSLRIRTSLTPFVSLPLFKTPMVDRQPLK